MLFLAFFSFIQTKNKICICNKECPSICSHRFLLQASNQQFEDFLMPYINDKKEIELNFYSKYQSILFYLNLSYFGDTKVCLHTLNSSKPAKITLIENQIHKKIQVDPLHRVCLPELTDLEHLTNNISNTEKNSSKSNLLRNEPIIYKSEMKTPLDYAEFVNISCNDLEYDGWHIGFNESDAKQGSYTKTPNEKASYTFTGTKVQLFSLMNNESAIAIIKIDNKYTYEVDLYRKTQEYGISFTSDVLSFGQHTIEIIHSGKSSHSNEDSSIIIVSLLVYLLPKKNGRKLGFNDLKNKVGNWQKDENSPLFLSSSDDDLASGTFEFYGNRFFLTGIKAKSKTGFKILVDDKNSFDINDTITEAQVNDQEELNPTILYQSDILDVGYHTVTIQKVNSDVSLINLLYIEVPYIDQTIIENLDGLVNVRCSEFGKGGGAGNSREDGNMGLCIDLIEEGSHVWTNFYGTKVHVFGFRAQHSPKVRIDIDNEEVATLDLAITSGQAMIVYTSEDLQFGLHSITLTVVETKQGKDAFHISSFIYDPLPKCGGYKFSYNDRTDKNGKWTQITNKTPYFHSSETNARITFKFYGTRFWLTGVQDNTRSMPKITYDGVQVNGHFNSEDAAKGFDLNRAVLLYTNEDKDDKREYKDHTLIIEKTDKDVSIVNLLYVTHQEDSICVPAKDMKIIGNWKEEETGGYSTNDPHSLIEFSQYFTHIWIFSNKTINNARLNVYANEKFVKYANSDALTTTTKSDDILFAKVDRPISHYNVNLEHGGEIGQSLHIEYCYYLNDASISGEGETINAADLKTKSEGDWTIKNNRVVSSTKGSTITIELNFCKFYIKSRRHPSYGNIDIILDDEEIDSISLYCTKNNKANNVFVYESPKKCGNHILKLVNHDDRVINIAEFKYVKLPSEQSLIDNLDGLINITCDKLTYAGVWRECVKESNTTFGSFTSNTDANASYKFFGTKFYVKASLEDNVGLMNVYIDDKFVSQINVDSDKAGKEPKIVYSSDDLPFGEHTICVKRHTGSIIISSFIINPLPKIGGYKLGYKDLKDADISGNWIEDNQNTPYFKSNSDGASVIFRFHGTRFWLTGVRSNSYGDFYLIIDDNNTLELNCRINTGTYTDGADGNEAILLHESDVYELKDHFVKIQHKSGTNPISIVNLFYTTQPKNATYIPFKDMEFKGKWAPQENGGYSLIDPNSALEFSRYFNHFWILGNKNLGQANLNIYSDDQFDNMINCNQIEVNDPSKEILFSKIDKSILNHKIKLENGGSSGQNLHIDYCYYVNDKEIIINSKTDTFNIDELINNVQGDYTVENSKLYLKRKGSTITLNFVGSTFWIIGSMDPYYGVMDIKFDNKQIATVSLYNEAHNDNIIYYESPKLIENGNHVLVVSNHDDNPICISEIKYKPLPPTDAFTKSAQFSNSVYFSESNYFSKTSSFTETNDFTNSKHFSKSNNFSNSEYFSKSNYFSQTTDFTKSTDFTASAFFSKSNEFLQTGDFTKSNAFSSSAYFSKSNDFSTSDYFSKTKDFTKSSDFSTSAFFSKSNDFTETKKFSRTNDFTNTALFSETKDFSFSISFSKSNDFSKSDNFAKTSDFTNSALFSETKDFSSLIYFTKSRDFSKSNDFSSSNYFTNPPDLNCIGNNRCNLDSFIDSGDMINLSNREYINLSNTENGAAIRLINYTLICENTKFINCSSSQGGGGIYIVVERPIERPIILENLTFIKCKAVYGGAVYIYNNQPSSVRIKSCIFNQNMANKYGASPGDTLYGGGACYLQIIDSNITNCTFYKNIGNCVKILDIVKDDSSLLLATKEEVDSSISIEDCYFEIDKISSSSLFLVRGKSKQQTHIDIKDCTFVGDLSKGAHHIDGTSLLNEKTSKEESKIRIKSCRFSSDIENAVNSKKHPLLFASFDSDSQIFNFKDTVKSELINEIVFQKENFNKMRLGANVVVITAASVFIILVIAAVIISKKNNSSLEDILDNENILEIQKNDI
ncbi:hypothetical protein M9Y10_029743 [Tritrichomonas musculus]|uniref:PA14 domain-containing protein n=1 Tax=Tritrichomonas musculus TaxID=1915356 RepID=A0ABR2KN24_9EUKA